MRIDSVGDGKYRVTYTIPNHGGTFERVVDESIARLLLRAIEHGKRERSRELRKLLEG